MKTFAAHVDAQSTNTYVLADERIWSIIVQDEGSDYFYIYLADVGDKQKAVDLAKMLNEREVLKNG